MYCHCLYGVTLSAVRLSNHNKDYGWIMDGDVNRPDECLSVREALDLYTLGGAYAAMQEHRLGRLLPGYQADFVVLDKDVCSSPADLLSVRVLEVWVAGHQKL